MIQIVDNINDLLDGSARVKKENTITSSIYDAAHGEPYFSTRSMPLHVKYVSDSTFVPKFSSDYGPEHRYLDNRKPFEQPKLSARQYLKKLYDLAYLD